MSQERVPAAHLGGVREKRRCPIYYCENLIPNFGRLSETLCAQITSSNIIYS